MTYAVPTGYYPMSRPRLLDLFSGAGGAGMGYHRAGFEVVGVDIEPQPRYPFTFHQADAFEFLEAHWEEFDLFHASPMCQKFTRLNSIHKRNYPDQISDIRTLLKTTGKPYVIENVPEAPLLNPITLCGTMFSLRVIRHRNFETKPVIWFPPAPCNHWGKSPKKGIYGIFENGFDFLSVTGGNFRVNEAQIAMGIDWMTRKELAQAIPPAYTFWLGRQLLAILERANQ